MVNDNSLLLDGTDATNGIGMEGVDGSGDGEGQPGYRQVTHDYHDFSSSSATLSNVPNASSATPAFVDHSFPTRLHYCLKEMERDGLSHIVSWQPHGRCFVVHDKKYFMNEVLGSWFRMSKMASFQRQLNLYGFRRLSSGPDKGGYYHEFFLRQRPHLATHIRRFKIKGCGMRKPASPDSEPNLYYFPFLPPNVDNGHCNEVAHVAGVDSILSICMHEGAFQHLPPLAGPLAPTTNTFLPSTPNLSTSWAAKCNAALTGQTLLHVGEMLPPAPGMATSARSITLLSALSAGLFGDRPMTLALLQHFGSNSN